MDSSRTKAGMIVYWLGVAAPILIVTALTLLERLGVKSSLGVAWIALVSLAICIVGVFLVRATARKKFELIVLAVVIIPAELLVGAVFFLMSAGLSGTQ